MAATQDHLFVHPRMSMQKSCFTFHGKGKKPLSHMVREPILMKYVLDTNNMDDVPSDSGRMRISLQLSSQTLTFSMRNSPAISDLEIRRQAPTRKHGFIPPQPCSSEQVIFRVWAYNQSRAGTIVGICERRCHGTSRYARQARSLWTTV